MPQSLTPTDHVKAKEFISFLRAMGLYSTLKAFDREWENRVKQEKQKRTTNGGNKTTPVPSEPRSLSSTIDKSLPKKLAIIRKEPLFISAKGVREEIWKHTDKEHLSPNWMHGGGISLDEYYQIEGRVEFVETAPYKKEAPPTGLPLETFDLRIVCEAGKTGFEESRDFPIEVGALIAGRYKILRQLDSATFSHAVKCLDVKHGDEVCIKIIRNSKDFFDQGIDELKVINFVNRSGDSKENCVLQLFDYFYFKEHIFIVTELLKDNLFRFAKYNREEQDGKYFTLARLQSITKQILTALRFIHSLQLIHCDLKPENILLESVSSCRIKVIDFGSSCFITDSLSSYVQSRCYRAPEAILGCKYDARVDIWSLGAIIPELATGKLLFRSESVAIMLSSISTVCGHFPTSLLHEGRNTPLLVTKSGAFHEKKEGSLLFHFANPRREPTVDLFGFDDEEYVDFVAKCLTIDYKQRPTAAELLQHPFMQKDYSTVCDDEPPVNEQGPGNESVTQAVPAMSSTLAS